MRGIVQINEQSPPFDAALLWNSWVAIRSKTIMTEFVNEFGSIDHLLSSDLKEEAKWEIRQGHSITQETLNNAIEIASQWSDCVDNLFQSNQILVLPTAQVWPFPAEWKYSSVIGEKTMDTYHRWMEVTIPCSLAGLPCTTVPLGSTIPMGLQLIGKRGSDEELFAVAQLYYEAITR
jgi:amidase